MAAARGAVHVAPSPRAACSGSSDVRSRLQVGREILGASSCRRYLHFAEVPATLWPTAGIYGTFRKSAGFTPFRAPLKLKAVGTNSPTRSTFATAGIRASSPTAQ